MHFGLLNLTFMKNKLFPIVLVLISIAFGCKEKSKQYLTLSSPYQGQNFNLGEDVKLQIDLPADGAKIDEVTYLIDNKTIGSYKNNNEVTLTTKGLKLGYRIINAIVKHDGEIDTITTNFVLKSNQKPIQLAYNVVNTFPHDTSAYTQGLNYVDGKLLESTGQHGTSELKWVALNSGNTLQRTKLDSKYFGEGSVMVGNKIVMLTWQENIGLIFDANTFQQTGTFPYQESKEGWGLAFDGKQILRSDGSNRIWFMNADTYKEESFIEVYDDKGPLDSLNELEYINGKIYANVYLSNKIVIIDPLNGLVEAEIDLSALGPKNYFKTEEDDGNNVLNGIAWDAKGKRLFVTGKRWPKLFEIKLQKASAK